MQKYNKWVAFFSQTGSEISSISQRLNRWPDLICTNKSIDKITDIDPYLLTNCFKKIIFLPPTPTLTEYNTSLNIKKINQNDIITLHGYLKILPPNVCNEYVIYNGHPGDIVEYPILKGFNPQEKAFNKKIKNTGCVIHKVTSVVDDGEIVAHKKCQINLKSLSLTYKLLHQNSINLWVDFLKSAIII